MHTSSGHLRKNLRRWSLWLNRDWVHRSGIGRHLLVLDHWDVALGKQFPIGIANILLLLLIRELLLLHTVQCKLQWCVFRAFTGRSRQSRSTDRRGRRAASGGVDRLQLFLVESLAVRPERLVRLILIRLLHVHAWWNERPLGLLGIRLILLYIPLLI